ncbi:MAG: hypothetical protein ACE5JX_07180 [Acidobacteriota bacterium]
MGGKSWELSKEGTAFLFYLALSAAVLFPLVRNFGHVIAGGTDAFIHYWDLWWIYRGAWLPGQSLFWTDYLDYPIGQPLYLRPFNLTSILMVGPVYGLAGLTAAHAATTLLAFVLSGFFTYLLVYRLVGNRWAALFSGLIFTLSPFHLAHTQGGHVSMSCLQWLPLDLLALVSWWEKRSWARAIGVGLCLGLTFFTDWYLALYALVATGLWVAAGVLGKEAPRDRRLWAGLFAAGLVALMLAIPVLLPALGILKQAPRPAGHLSFSADVVGFFVPGSTSVWGPATETVWRDFTGNNYENGNYLGYVSLAFALAGAWSWKQGRRVWLWIAGAGLLLSLGPYLKVGGHYEFPTTWLGLFQPLGDWVRETIVGLYPDWSISAGHLALPLPYLALKSLPFLNVSRAPARFVALVVLGMSVLAGAGLAHMLGRRKGNTRLVLAILPLLLVGVEFWPRLTFLQPRLPEGFEVLQGKGRGFAIADLHFAPLAAFYQTQHGLKLMGAYGGRGYQPAIDFLKHHSLHEFLRGGTAPHSLAPILATLRQHDVRYIVVPVRRQAILEALRSLEVGEIYSGPGLSIFRTTGSDSSRPEVP